MAPIGNPKSAFRRNTLSVATGEDHCPFNSAESSCAPPPLGSRFGVIFLVWGYGPVTVWLCAARPGVGGPESTSGASKARQRTHEAGKPGLRLGRHAS